MKKRIICLLLALICFLTCLPPALHVHAATTLPDEIYIKQSPSKCTIASAAMMLRARTYLSGNMDWDTITEDSASEVGWSGGLSWNWTYRIDDTNYLRVTRASFESDGVGGTTISELKALLDAHPEGITFYCGNYWPHAVFLTDYEGDTFYCADPAGGYWGKRIKLADSLLGDRFGTQAEILQTVSSYWYISDYHIEPSGYIGYCTEYPAYSTVKVTYGADAMTLPCTSAEDSESEVITAVTSGEYTAIAVMENKDGVYWYEIILSDGSTGYIPYYAAEYQSYSDSDIAISNANAPTEHVKGNSFVIKGSITSKYNNLSGVSAYIYAGTDIDGTAVTGGSASINKKSYSLQSSAVDNSIRFGSLSVGSYTYVVRASYINYYVTEAGVLASNKGTLILHQAAFTVVDPNATFTVTFDGNGGTPSVSTAETKENTALGTLPTATREGYTFAGWFTEPFGGTQVTTDTIISSNMTVYAQWNCDHTFSTTVTQEATCTEEGEMEHVCTRCAYSYTEEIERIDHDYTSEVVDATCTSHSHILYTCQECGDSYTAENEDIYSAWSTEKPTGVDESLIESKVEYRYADYESKTSYESTLDGYQVASTAWEAIETGTIEYVPTWPSGFLKTTGIYNVYAMEKIPAFENESNKTTINYDKLTGYLYFHWCQGRTLTNGPGNNYGKSVQSPSYNCNTFHAFYSTMAPDEAYKMASDGSVWISNGDCCKDTVWYFPVEVYTQSYTSWRKLYTHYRWTDWSDWSQTAPEESSTRKVETRTLYRYMKVALTGHSWDEGVISSSGCDQAQVKVYTCQNCGETKEEQLSSVGGHDYAASVTPPSCTAMGYTTYTCTKCGDSYEDDYVDASDHDYETDVIAPTCQSQGYTVYKCSGCGDFYTDDFTPVTDHDYDPVVTAPTCTDSGYTTYTCFDCKYSYIGDQVEATGHSFESGSCTVCGEADPGYEEPAPELFNLEGITMTLGNRLDMNFVIDTAKLEGDGHYAVIVKSYADGNTTKVTVDQADWENFDGADWYYFTFSGVAAKEMTDTITVNVYNADGEQVTYEWVDSVEAYCIRMLPQAQSEEEATLYVDMLNYGAAAQSYFGYKTDDLANADLTAEQQAKATQSVSMENKLSSGTGYVGSALTLESCIQLDIVFDGSQIEGAATAVATYTDHYGAAQRVEYEKFGEYEAGMPMISLTGMSVADCSQMVTLTVYDAEGKVLSTVEDSVESYVARMTESDPLFETIMKFATSSYNYFH